MIQNAVKSVKYNCNEGDMIMLISLDKSQSNVVGEIEEATEYSNCFFNFEIIDSGTGISLEKQSFLYKPFLELNQRKNMDKVMNNSIGLGLTCSQLIIGELKGRLSLQRSNEGITVFSV